MACANHPTVNEGIVRCTRCHRQFCQDCVAYLRGFPYCASCKNEQVRDVQSGTTPGTLELASLGRRFGARWIDGFITSMALFPCTFGIGFFVAAAGASANADSKMVGVLAQLLVLPISIGVPLVYEGLMLQKRGQTLGKMALGIKVVTPEGSDITPGQAWGRTALWTFLSCLDAIPALFTPEKTCIHDMAAKTRVVRLR